MARSDVAPAVRAASEGRAGRRLRDRWGLEGNRVTLVTGACFSSVRARVCARARTLEMELPVTRVTICRGLPRAKAARIMRIDA
jgi:hypothetical protein